MCTDFVQLTESKPKANKASEIVRVLMSFLLVSVFVIRFWLTCVIWLGGWVVGRSKITLFGVGSVRFRSVRFSLTVRFSGGWVGRVRAG